MEHLIEDSQMERERGNSELVEMMRSLTWTIYFGSGSKQNNLLHFLVHYQSLK